MRLLRPISALVVAAVTVATCAPRRLPALDEKQACIDAADKGQALRNDGKLLAARKEFIACGRETCPALVKKDCLGWLSDVDGSLSSIVVGAKTSDGRDVSDVRVFFDGELLAKSAAGQAIMVDPGKHVLRFEADGHKPVSQEITLLSGVKNRVIDVVFQPESKTPSAVTATASSGPPAAAWVLGGVGLVALGGFAWFGLSGRRDLDHLRSTCAPYCATTDLDAAKRKMLFADISLGVGLLSLAAATWLTLSHKPPTSTDAKSGKSAPLRVDARVLAGGALAELAVAF